MGITHFETAPRREVHAGHLHATWTYLGDAAESLAVGVRRIEIPPGGWSTPVHEHGREEEIFYVLSGSGLSLRRGRTSTVKSGDCIVYLPGGGGHTLHATEQLDVLAFGTRLKDGAASFPRLDLSVVGSRAVESVDALAGGVPIQYLREAELGPPELAAVDDGLAEGIVNLEEVVPERIERPRVARTRRNLGRGAGSVATGLQHVDVDPGKESTAQHCHSLEEEIFVVLSGEGAIVLDQDELPVRPGHVVCRPPGTGVAHVFRAGAAGLTYLAYGTREPGDVCYYPRSNKLAFRGVKLIGRLERLDYWDGED